MNPTVAIVRSPHAEGLPLPAYESAQAGGHGPARRGCWRICC